MFRLGVLYAGAGRNADAVAAFEKVVGLDPQRADAFAKLGAIHQLMGAEAASIKAYKQAVKARSDDPELRFEMGIAFAAFGKFDDAADTLKGLVAMAPDHAPGRRALGLMFHELGKHAEAVPLLEKSATAKGDDIEVLFALATSQAGLDQHAERPWESSRVCNCGSTQNYAGAAARWARARVARSSAHPRRRSRHSRRPSRCFRTTPTCSFTSADGVAKPAQQFDRALSLFEKAARVRPEHAPSHFSLGVLNRRLQRMEPAIASVERAVAADPTDGSMQYALEVSCMLRSGVSRRRRARTPTRCAIGRKTSMRTRGWRGCSSSCGDSRMPQPFTRASCSSLQKISTSIKRSAPRGSRAASFAKHCLHVSTSRERDRRMLGRSSSWRSACTRSVTFAAP